MAPRLAQRRRAASTVARMWPVSGISASEERSGSTGLSAHLYRSTGRRLGHGSSDPLATVSEVVKGQTDRRSRLTLLSPLTCRFSSLAEPRLRAQGSPYHCWGLFPALLRLVRVASSRHEAGVCRSLNFTCSLRTPPARTDSAARDALHSRHTTLNRRVPTANAGGAERIRRLSSRPEERPATIRVLGLPPPLDSQHDGE